jgi:hypothetical protein
MDSNKQDAVPTGKSAWGMRQLNRIENVAKAIWTHHATGWILVAGTFIACLFFWYWPQPAGVAIAVLGGVVGVMTFREMVHTQKVLAALAILLLMGVEVRNIRSDQYARDQQIKTDRIAEDNRFADLLKQQQHNFAEVLAQNRSQFNATIHRTDRLIARSDAILRASHSAATSAENAVKNLTGGDSYPNISVVGPLDPDGLYGFLASAQGGYPLNDVQLNIVDESSSHVCSIELRSLLSGVAELVPGCYVKLTTDITMHYRIEVFSKNGLTMDILTVTKRDGRRLEQSIKQSGRDGKEIKR